MITDRFNFRVWDEGMFDDSKGKYIYADVFTGLALKLANGNQPIEQCTGIKDAAGKLVYENDVLRVFNIKTSRPEKCVMKWCDECGLWQLESLESDYITDAYRAEKFEIIGNIHTTDKDK